MALPLPMVPATDGGAHRVIGAGPSGLVAAATLPRAGHQVTVLDQGTDVGHRFAGDFQGVENWSTTRDALDWLDNLGDASEFEYQPFHEATFYDHHLDPPVARGGSGPLFYLIRRGPMEGTPDRALLDHAGAGGVTVEFSRREHHARRGDVVATGPRFADGLVTGFVFSTALENQARCIISDRVAPAGYAYLLTWNGRATLATCLFRRHQDWKAIRAEAVAAFATVVPGLIAELDGAEPFSGFGSVFPAARYTDEAARLFVGEAAGLQDPQWGFGLRYAIESGHLAARCLLDGSDYGVAAAEAFDRRVDAAFANRLLYEALPEAVVPALLRRGAAAADLRRRLRHHWRPSRTKSVVAHLARRGFARTRLRHRDRACHSAWCDCVWCTHGPDHGSHDDVAIAEP